MKEHKDDTPGITEATQNAVDKGTRRSLTQSSSPHGWSRDTIPTSFSPFHTLCHSHLLLQHHLGVSYLQDTIFGPGTSDTAKPAETPADPRLKKAPAVNIEEAMRDQVLSEPPTELLKEANAAKREGERDERAGETQTSQ